MAESNNSLLQFDSGILDVNENLSNSENHLIADTVQIYESVPSVVDNVDLLGDTTICKPSHSLPENCFEMPDNSPECIHNQLDLLSQNCNENINSSKMDSGVHDSDNFVDNTKLLDFNSIDLNLSNGCGVITKFNNEENFVDVKDEEFHDAVQFFKDPSSLTFLENAGTSSAVADPLISRSSLYMNFDPLHAKFFSQSSKSNALQDIVECDVEPEVSNENTQNQTVSDIVNKHIANVSPRASLGNILISFDSPVPNKNEELVEKIKTDEPKKLYTEEELHQALKIQEFSLQDTFLKRQHDLELDWTQKQEEMEAKIEKQQHLCSTLHSVLKEVLDISASLSDKENLLFEKLENIEKENKKLKEDLKTSVEDLQSVESTFSDFHKRYEQCKSMLKVYTQNEDNLKIQLEDLKVQLSEKDEMYKVLQSRTQEMLDRANTEVSNAKKAGDAQVAVLKAQLKKAELKISSLESDVKHVKIENDKLSSICDELMAKVSES